VFSFFPSGLFVEGSDFGVTFAGGDASHSEVHTNFGAFAGEVHAETFDDFRVNTLGNANAVFVSPFHFTGVSLEGELGASATALRALFRGSFADVDITADGAYILVHFFSPCCVYRVFL
jgi:hypothetical protein